MDNMNILTYLKNKRVLFIVLPLFLAMLLFVMQLFQPKQQTTPSNTQSPIQTLLPTAVPTLFQQPQQGEQDQTNPPIEYNPEGVRTLRDRLENKRPLSQSDRTIRQSMILALPQSSGTIHQTSTYKIQYIRAPDLFMIEIRSTDIEQAKTDAVTWFYDQGISKFGVCDLPVVFYLNGATAQSLREQNVIFNPSPEGC